jgi:RimJ/RimL family protein N-acetyltransferase
VDIHTDEPLGWVFTYGYAIWEQRCFLVIYVVPEARRFGAAAEVGMLFLDYLFSYFPIRKVAAEVFSFNHTSLDVLKHAGFHVEGVLRQEHYFGGHFHDVVRVGLLETEWRSLRERFRVGQLSHVQDDSISPERIQENGRQPTTDS